MPCRVTDGIGRTIAVIRGGSPYSLGELGDVIAWCASRAIPHVRLPAARFEGDAPLMWSGFTGITIEGAKYDFPGVASDTAQTTLVQTDPTQPGIVCDATRGVTVENVDLAGQNFDANTITGAGSTIAVWDWEQNGVTRAHSGIVVKGASSGTRFLGMSVRSFRQPFDIGPTGDSNDAEGVIRDCHLYGGKAGVLMGHSQCKGWLLDNVHFLGFEKGIISHDVNQVAAANPKIVGGSMHFVHQAFDIANTAQGLSVYGMDFESVNAIGVIGQGATAGMMSADFHGGTWTFWETTSEDVAHHLDAWGNVNFFGLALAFHRNPSVGSRMRLATNNRAAVNFWGTTFLDERKTGTANAPPVDHTALGALGQANFMHVNYRDQDSVTGRSFYSS